VLGLGGQDDSAMSASGVGRESSARRAYRFAALRPPDAKAIQTRGIIIATEDTASLGCVSNDSVRLLQQMWG
jgi:hypothetical protein